MTSPYVSSPHRRVAQRRRRPLLATCAMILAGILLPGAPAAADALPRLSGGIDPLDRSPRQVRKVHPSLIALQDAYTAHLASGSRAPFDPGDDGVRIEGDAVLVDAVSTGDGAALAARFEALEMRKVSHFKHMVSGWIPMRSIRAMGAIEELRFVRPAVMGTHVGVVDSQADAAQRSDTARALFSVDGTGITIGTLSDAYDCLGGEADDIASGDLPDDVVVLDDIVTGCIDEGRAMIQHMVDVAPGADHVFHTAFNGTADFAAGIVELADVGNADIIVDDVFYSTEPMFQDGIIAQAVDEVAALGVPYFSSAGNSADSSYESEFRDSGLAVPGVAGSDAHDFDPGPGTDILQRVTFPSGRTLFSLQWSQPYASATGGSGATSDLGVCVFQTNGSSLGCIDVANVGGDPVETLALNSPAGGQFDLALYKSAGTEPSLIKYIAFRSTFAVNEFDTGSPTSSGHSNAAGASAVAAAFYFETPPFSEDPALPESFTSKGGVPILFDLSDNPVVDNRPKPNITAPDGANTTFFGSDIADPGDGSDLDLFPNFFGTSAAAPHAAAVAALLLEAQPDLDRDEVMAIMEAGTEDMGPAGFDDLTGHGLINAELILDLSAIFDDGFESGDFTGWSSFAP